MHYRQTNHQRQFEIANQMQTFEDLLLQNDFTKFLDVAHKSSSQDHLEPVFNKGRDVSLCESIRRTSTCFR